MFENINITISDLWFTFLLSTLAPLIVGLITKRFVESRTKTYLLALVTVVIQVLTELGHSFNLNELLTKIFMAFILSIGIHYRILKPGVQVAGVTLIPSLTSADGLVNKIAPDIGIGTDYGGNDLLPDPDLIAAENKKRGIKAEDYPHGH